MKYLAQHSCYICEWDIENYETFNLKVSFSRKQVLKISYQYILSLLAGLTDTIQNNIMVYSERFCILNFLNKPFTVIQIHRI